MKRLVAAGSAAVGMLLAGCLLTATALAFIAGAGAAAGGSIQTSVVPAAYVPLYEKAGTECGGITPSLLAAQGYLASGFDPNFIDPDIGAAGIAGLTSITWTSWGADADGDGVASPLDPTDAIDTQARYLCHLLDRAKSSGLGDPLQLALAAYQTSWDRISASGGIPADEDLLDYIGRLIALADAWSTAAPAGSGSGGMFVDGHSQITLPRANPNSTAQAIDYAHAAVDGPLVWYRRCLAFTAHAYGWNASGVPSAAQYWATALPGFKRLGDRSPPVGALLFWDTGGISGHVALYLGGGFIASNDILRHGGIDIVPASDIEIRWGATYRGWTLPYYRDGV